MFYDEGSQERAGTPADSPNSSHVANPSTPAAQVAKADPVLKCSYCGTSFRRSETKNMPFCSRRCQQIDLGMWLNESYGFPHEGDDAVRDYDLDSEE